MGGCFAGDRWGDDQSRGRTFGTGGATRKHGSVPASVQFQFSLTFVPSGSTTNVPFGRCWMRTPPVCCRKTFKACRSLAISLRTASSAARSLLKVKLAHALAPHSTSSPDRTIAIEPEAIHSGTSLCRRSIRSISLIKAVERRRIALSVERSALSDSLLKLSPSRRSSLRVSSSTSARSALALRASFSAKLGSLFGFVLVGFALASLSLSDPFEPSLEVGRTGPSFSIDLSLQAEPVPRLRVQRRHVRLALPGHVQSRVLQRRHQARPVLDRPAFDPIRHEGVQRLAAVEPHGALATVTDLAGMHLLAGAFGIVRPRPAVFVVERIPQRIEGALPAGRGDVERPTGVKLQPRRYEVKFDPPGASVLVRPVPVRFGPLVRSLALLRIRTVRVRVAHPQDVVLVRLQPREGDALELVHDAFLLGLARAIFRRERQDARRVAPLPIDPVDQLARLRWIAPQHLGQRVRSIGGRCR